MCHRSPFTRDEHDRPPYQPPVIPGEPFWPHFVAADNGHCFGDGLAFHVRLPGPRPAADKWVGVSREHAEENVEAYPGVPVEVGAFIEATEQAAEGSPELRQYRQLIRLLEMVSEVAMDMMAGHGRLCGCKLCVWLSALDDRQPGLKATTWARIEELPAALQPVASMLANWVLQRDVSTAKPIRLTPEHLRYCTPAVTMAYPEKEPARPKVTVAAPKQLKSR